MIEKFEDYSCNFEIFSSSNFNILENPELRSSRQENNDTKTIHVSSNQAPPMQNFQLPILISSKTQTSMYLEKECIQTTIKRNGINSPATNRVMNPFSFPPSGSLSSNSFF